MRLFCTAVVMLLFAGFGSTAFSQGVVNFPDPNLEAGIRDVIAIPTGPIYDTDCATLPGYRPTGAPSMIQRGSSTRLALKISICVGIRSATSAPWRGSPI